MAADETRTQTEVCAARRLHLGPVDPIRIARQVLIVCTKESGHQSPHYDASCDVSWPHESDDETEFSDTFVCDNDGDWIIDGQH